MLEEEAAPGAALGSRPPGRPRYQHPADGYGRPQDGHPGDGPWRLPL